MGSYTIEAKRADGSVLTLYVDPPERVGTSMLLGEIRTEEGYPVHWKAKGEYEVHPSFGAAYRVTSDDPNAP